MAFHFRSVAQACLDPCRRIEERGITVAATDELDPEGGPGGSAARGQGDAGCPGKGPDRVEAGVARPFEAGGGLAGCARGEDGVRVGEGIVEESAESLRHFK